MDPCPNKLINCESINADLDSIYHQIYWECVFSFSKERQNPPLYDCLKGKWRRSKVSYIQKEIFRQTQFPIWGCLFRQTTDGVQHRDLLKKPFSILLTSRSKHCLPLMVSRRLSAQANPVENHFSTLNKRVQSELGVPLIVCRHNTLGAVTLDVSPKVLFGEIAWVGFTMGD